jgi:hypothetical protein
MTIVVVLATWLGVAVSAVLMILVFALGGRQRDH